MKGWIVGLSLAAMPFAAQAQTNDADERIRLDPVHISNPLEPGSAGNGARFQVQGRCATVTAAHVVAGTSEPEITPLRSPVDAARVKKSIRRFDTAVIWQKHAAGITCGTLPSAERISDAIQSASTREVYLIDAGGGQRLVNVDLVSRNSFDLVVKIDDRESYSGFRPGNSGALLVFDGVPVGILTDAFTGLTREATAIKLDFVLREFAEQLPQQGNALEESDTTPSAQTRFAPFAIEQLPSDFQKMIRGVRRMRTRVNAIAKRADEVKQTAESHAQRTYALPPLTLDRGVAWFEVDAKSDEQKRIYRGQAFKTGSTFNNKGYGVVRHTSVKFLDNTYYCDFVPGRGCSGIGMLSYGRNEANRTLREFYKGAFEGAKRVGPAHIKWSNDREGTRFVTAELWGDTNNQSPMTQRSTDNRWYEGQSKDLWNGMGVVWDAQGRVIQLGTWRNGQTETNVTKAWRDGTYVPGSLREIPLDTASE